MTPEALLSAALAELAEDPDNVDLVALVVQLRLVVFHRQMRALERWWFTLDALVRRN